MHKYRPQRNYGCRIHDQYTYFGMKTVVIENDLIRISILIDKGTEIYEYLYKPKDIDFMWLTENGVQNPTDYLSTSADPISAFIDYYPGGWQEVFPNGGPTSVMMGAKFGQHGEVAHMPWDYQIIEDSPERIAVRFWVRTKKVPFQVSKILTLLRGKTTLMIEEEIENLSDIPLQYMWGQHLAFGKPFLDTGCILTLPENIKILTEPPDLNAQTGRVKRGPVYEWPFAEGLDGGTINLAELPEAGTPSEIVYLTGFGETGLYNLLNKQIGVGIQVEWDAGCMPYLWYWQEYGGTQEYPWYGRHYNIGLEPFAGYPTHGLTEAIRNGSAGTIQGKEKKRCYLKTTPYVTST